MAIIRFCSRIALAFLILPASFIVAAAQQEIQQDFVPGELIIGYRSAEAQASATRELEALADEGGLRTRGGDATSRSIEVEPIDDVTMRLKLSFVTRRGTPPTKTAERRFLEETAELLRQDERVEYAHPNWILNLDRQRILKAVRFEPGLAEIQLHGAQVLSGPNDPVFVQGLHWRYRPPPHGMNAIETWKRAREDGDVVVAVLDTGLLPDHPNIKGRGNVLPGYDFVSDPYMAVD